MTVQRHLADQLCDPGSDRALCSAPLSPPVLGGGDDDDSDWVARVLSSFGDGSIVASTLRWSSVVGAVVAVGGRRGGEGARRFVEFLAGVRRTSIDTRRYKSGWTRLSTGKRKRRAKALATRPGTGSRGLGVSSHVAANGDGRGPDDRTADAPP